MDEQGIGVFEEVLPAELQREKSTRLSGNKRIAKAAAKFAVSNFATNQVQGMRLNSKAIIYCY